MAGHSGAVARPLSTAKGLKEHTALVHGYVDEAFNLAVLDGGLDWKPMSHSLVDAQVVETRRLRREECTAGRDAAATWSCDFR